MPEFRELAADHRVRFQEFVDYAFHPEDGPQSYESAADTPDRLGRRFGVFDGGDLRSVCTHYDFAASVRGEWLPAAGLASVATLPEHRGSGYVSDLVAGSLERWRGEYALSALWPFEYPFYRQYGYATATRLAVHTLPPGKLAGFDDGTGRFERVTPDDLDRLRPVHEARGADVTLTLRRDEDWWRERVFSTIFGEDCYVYAWVRDGAVRAYVAFYFEDEDGDRTLKVHDRAARDAAGERAVLGFLARHAAQTESVVLTERGDAPLLDRLPRPKAVETDLRTGPMARIADVEVALESVPYPGGVAADLALAVADDRAPWNDGVVRLSVADGEGTVERVGDRDAVEADATVDVGTLTQVYLGYRGVDAARRAGDLSVADEGAAESLRALFPGRPVALTEFF